MYKKKLSSSLDKEPPEDCIAVNVALIKFNALWHALLRNFDEWLGQFTQLTKGHPALAGVSSQDELVITGMFIDCLRELVSCVVMSEIMLWFSGAWGSLMTRLMRCTREHPSRLLSDLPHQKEQLYPSGVAISNPSSELFLSKPFLFFVNINFVCQFRFKSCFFAMFLLFLWPSPYKWYLKCVNAAESFLFNNLVNNYCTFSCAQSACVTVQ